MDVYFSGKSQFASWSCQCFCRLDAETKETFGKCIFFYMQQLLHLSNVNMEQVQAKLCPGVQHQDTCTAGRVLREVQYHRWGWRNGFLLERARCQRAGFIFVATCYMGPFNIAWKEAVTGVWWKSSWLTIFSAPPPLLWLPVALLTGRRGQEHSAVIWTSGRSVSQGPRRCEIWDTFHSTLPSFWRKERRATSQAKRQLFMPERRLFFEGAWLIDSLLLTRFLNWLRGKGS